MNWLISKLLTGVVFVFHPLMKGQYRWFIRFYYLGSLRQLKFYHKDFVLKRVYKELKFFGEFQQELLYALPHAYWHYLNGTLKKTVSAKGTAPFYFFSPNHEERYVSRKWKGNFNTHFPNGPHNHRLNNLKWAQVPFKEHYSNNEFCFNKPTLVIANRYNTEWGNSPISFFDLDCLDKTIKKLRDRYQIVYNRPGEDEITNDNSEIMELRDKEWIRKEHPEVIVLSDLLNKADNNFNELQLKVYANCTRFISIHGGTATLASYFGGINIIFSKRGHEHYLKEFENIFPKMANTSIYHVKSYLDLYFTIESVF